MVTALHSEGKAAFAKLLVLKIEPVLVFAGFQGRNGEGRTAIPLLSLPKAEKG